MRWQWPTEPGTASSASYARGWPSSRMAARFCATSSPGAFRGVCHDAEPDGEPQPSNGREVNVTPILVLFVTHWTLSIFAQTFFLHRYGAHRMFRMIRFWDRFFYLFSFIAQGPSFLIPRAYAILHREHHAFSDTQRDPHSPRFFSNAASMMWQTKRSYDRYAYRRAEPEARFLGPTPEWQLIDRLSQSWITRMLLGTLYALFYLHFAPSAGWFLLLPVHWLMGPIHGAIVNWCGHRYGYANFDNGDQ